MERVRDTAGRLRPAFHKMNPQEIENHNRQPSENSGALHRADQIRFIHTYPLMMNSRPLSIEERKQRFEEEEIQRRSRDERSRLAEVANQQAAAREIDPNSFVRRHSSGSNLRATMTIREPIELFQKSEILVSGPRVLSQVDRDRALKAGINLESNYLGRIDDFAIDNASCPHNLNCALHITGIHPDASYMEIFEQIHEGGIFSFHRKDAVPGVFVTCVANLVFQKRSAAERFLNRCMGREGIKFRGRRIYAVWNRDRVRPQPEYLLHQSRVIWITGPEASLNGNSLEAYLHSKLAFELVSRRGFSLGNGLAAVELSFPSIRGQSRAAYKCCHSRLQELGMAHIYSIQYGPDPCDVSCGPMRPEWLL